MPLLILLLLLALPLMELAVLIDIGGEIGAVPTVTLCLLTAAIGLHLVRLQGMRVIADMQSAASSGDPVAAALVHGFFLLVSGICLFIPGFITDLLGALFLIPTIRLYLGRKMLSGGYMHKSQGGFHTHSTIIIDGDFTEKPDTQTARTKDRQSPPVIDHETLEKDD